MKFSEKQHAKPVPIEIEYEGKCYKGTGVPISDSCEKGVCFDLNITLNGKDLGIIHSDEKGGWEMKSVEDKGLVEAIGEEIQLWYE